MGGATTAAPPRPPERPMPCALTSGKQPATHHASGPQHARRRCAQQAVQSLHSHADLLLTKKSPPAIALAAGKPSCGWQKPDGGIKGLPVYVRTFPLAPLPAGCMPFFITRGTQRGFSRSALDWCNTSGPDNANTRNNRGGCCHGEFNPQCVGIEFGMPCRVQKGGAGVFKACRNDGG